MRAIKVEIEFTDGESNVYEVLSVYENFEYEDRTYLAMQRLKDFKWGLVPLEIIEGYKILHN